MTRNVLVVSHADADGHIIAEQVRRNLELIESFKVTVVVDPDRTKDHKVWTKLDSIDEVDGADIVFFVDLMFGPASFAQEAQALLRFVEDRPDKRFFLIDHHPLPLRRLSSAKNLRMAYRPDVFDMAFGPRSGMMVVAALCENQRSEVADVTQPTDEVLAKGMKRAAALGGPLPGEKLLALLRTDRWQELAKLGTEDKASHYLPRGRRPTGQPFSEALGALNEAAEHLLEQDENDAAQEPDLGRVAMAYDYEVGQERFQYDEGRRQRIRNAHTHSKDLEAIVTLLEVAALSLTSEPGETFSLDQLIREARSLAGDEIDLDERDIKIVLEKASFVEKVGRDMRLR